MHLFIDSADLNEIERWMSYGVVEGVTTNPSILRTAGVGDLRTTVSEIARMLSGQ